LGHIRKYANACFEVINATNVRGLFDAEELSVAATQQAVHDALRSRQSNHMGNKTPTMMRCMMEFGRVQTGQRKIKWGWQDTRGEKGGHMPEPFLFPFWRLSMSSQMMTSLLCASVEIPANSQNVRPVKRRITVPKVARKVTGRFIKRTANKTRPSIIKPISRRKQARRLSHKIQSTAAIAC
jgi:hypothetical protein